MCDEFFVYSVLQRAEELETMKPKVAYYLRLFACEEGMKVEKRSKELDGLLGSVLRKLETSKATAGVAVSPADDHLEIEGFALDVFTRADEADRAGRANASTAKTFYASSIFLQMLELFEKDGPLSPEIGTKARYAAWRASEINKAIREKRQPTPPTAMTALERGGVPTTPSAPDEDTLPPPPPSLSNGTSSSEYPSITLPHANAHPHAHAHAHAHARTEQDAKPVDYNVVNEAKKTIKYATSSLDFDDVEAAVTYLEKAVSLLKRLI